ncbi:hypothetical protein GCM10023185_09260 [Hymenobacter saemangeumensis]|uniref:Uncharacterized protein n=2 Tax=Hymenobacter saemangeumensis TaxID=1084522 RepID=A0ABP8I4M7_9BACT
MQWQPARGQSATPEPALAASVAALQARYDESFPGQPQLYSGTEYVDYSKRYHARIGHQFFLDAAPLPGSVEYDGYRHRNVALAYDLVRDKLLLTQPGSPILLQLVSERVSRFDLAGHRFVQLLPDSTAASAMRPGYYEVLVDSASQVLAKRSKTMQQLLVNRNIDVKFSPADKLFVRRGDTYYPVSKKKAALHAFADRSKEMQQYVQEHKLSFRKDQLEASLVLLARHYNLLATR